MPQFSAQTQKSLSSVENSSTEDGGFTVEIAIANLQGEDLGLRVYSAWWLGRFRVNTPTAIDLLIAALADEDDRTTAGGYPLRRNAARALGKLSNSRAIEPLIGCLSCQDFYVREAAVQSLEMLGDRSCIPALIKLLDGELGTLPAPEQPDLEQPYDAILEALGTLGADQTIPVIKKFLDHHRDRVRYAAARAMCQLTPTAQEAEQYGNILIDALASPEIQLRRTALADLGAIGYLPAADAIAATHTENSLKLVALKGILENQVDANDYPLLSEAALKVMTLMDKLL